MSRKSGVDDDDPAYVRIEDCRERHAVTAERVYKIEMALFGEDGRGGMVRDMGDIKADVRIIKDEVKEGGRGRLRGGDKALILAALIAAAASIIVQLLRL